MSISIAPFKRKNNFKCLFHFYVYSTSTIVCIRDKKWIKNKYNPALDGKRAVGRKVNGSFSFFLIVLINLLFFPINLLIFCHIPNK